MGSDHHDHTGHDHAHGDAHGDAHGHGHGHHVVFDSEEMADHAQTEAETLTGLLEQALDRLAAACAADGLEVRRVLDVGCGPGVAACRLAERFPDAAVVAADGSPTMLARAEVRAQQHGRAAQITTQRIDLPDGLATLGRADVLWASLVIHHVGDEATALRRVHDALEPGGLLALVEVADPVRVDVDDDGLGRPELWNRVDAAWTTWFAGMRAELPGATRSDPYPAMMAAAGFELVVDEVLAATIDAPLDAGARRFARRQVHAARTRLADQLDPADLAVLDELLDDDGEQSVMRRDDVRLRASRHLYLARRPLSSGR